ncbi:unnamed protein product [Heterobilharzia americana]|nr:unnamed protein product [Heterobilharzia americana]
MTEPQAVRRKRALSFAGYSELPKLSSNVTTAQPPTISRTRRPSFMCFGDHSTPNEVSLDISNKLKNANDTNLSFSGDLLLAKDPLSFKKFGTSNSHLCSRKSSVATVKGHFSYSCDPTPKMSPKQQNSYSDLMDLPLQSFDPSLPHYSDYILPNGPLSSKLVKLYLAKLTASKLSDNNCPVNSSRSISSKTCTHNELHCLPEYMQIRSPNLASMVMPVNQIVRAYANRNSFKCEQDISSHGESKENLNLLSAYFNDRNAFTDANYSSGLSDVESWSRSRFYDSIKNGYLSDNHLIEAASEAQKLSIRKRELELRLNMPSGSNSVSSCGTQATSRENLNKHPTQLNRRPLTPKFEFTHVYDGLLPPGLKNTNKSLANSMNTSQTKLNSIGDGFDDKNSSLYNSVPNLLNIHSNHSYSVNNVTLNKFDSVNTNGKRFERLRNLLTTLKGDNTMNKGEDDKYFYMDEKSLKHRIECQASNVISPVSF